MRDATIRPAMRNALIGLLAFNVFQVACETQALITNWENRIVLRGFLSLVLAALAVSICALVPTQEESIWAKSGRRLLRGILAAVALVLGAALLMSFQV